MGVVKIVRQGIKYSPALAAVVKEARGPVTEYAKTHLEAARHKRLAVTKAASLKDGSLLPIVHGEQTVWVVFSGDHPVATHPPVDVPLPTLLQHADLTQRRRPAAVGAGPTARLKAVRRRD